MCGIVGILNIEAGPERQRARAVRLASKLSHRGPDWSGVYVGGSCVLAHERLSIVDIDHGAQPIVTGDDQLALAVNGEIYNHEDLQDGLANAFPFQTASDCEVILPLYQEKGVDFLNDLNGIFAFILFDRDKDRFIIARDPMGVIPLYWGKDSDGHLLVASELKALQGECEEMHEFPPGHYWDSSSEEGIKPYYQPAWRDYAQVQDVAADKKTIRSSLEDAVHRQLMCDVPYGTLLSGGLDSSLVTAIACRYARKRVEDHDHSEAWFPRVHSFAIGLKDSPDLAAAQLAADALGTVHHTFTYSFDEGLDAIRNVIYHIETYDVTTIRASTPMFLLARRIKAMGIKMVLSGEGADEIFGGYLYFHKAPSGEAFHEETVRKLGTLHQYDCLRANKSMAAWGVEARVPFLDREFLDVAMGFDAEHKRPGKGRMEKHILRKAFDGLLPKEILWRQKEQFSDGVGYGWIDGLKAHAEKEVSDQDLAHASQRFLVNTPLSKEAYLYRAIFDEHFPGSAAASLVPGGKSIACSSEAALEWDQSFRDSADPSGRAIQGIHKDGY